MQLTDMVKGNFESKENYTSVAILDFFVDPAPCATFQLLQCEDKHINFKHYIIISNLVETFSLAVRKGLLQFLSSFTLAQIAFYSSFSLLSVTYSQLSSQRQILGYTNLCILYKNK